MSVALDVALHDLPLEPLTPEAFAPCGTVIAAGEDSHLPGEAELALDLSGGPPRYYVMRLGHRGRLVKAITRHVQVTQVLASVGGGEWLLGVAPPSPGQSGPDKAKLRAFRIPGDVALLLHRGTWHAGPYFDAPQMSFFNLELRDTNLNDHDTFRMVEGWGHGYRLTG
jgi:ureidoglycolate hydrolase